MINLANLYYYNAFPFKFRFYFIIRLIELKIFKKNKYYIIRH
jgi:hypothetical protein